jgi:hypothetical protein
MRDCVETPRLGVDVGAFETVSVMPMVCGLPPAPEAVRVIAPEYVLAVNPPGITETVKVVLFVLNVPLLGVTWSQLAFDCATNAAVPLDTLAVKL